VRPIAAFNGWRLRNELRGGQIIGAVAFPLSWTGYDEWPKLLEERGITREKSIIVYGYDRRDGEEIAEKLSDAGYKSVQIYDGFIDDWSANERLPMDRLPRYQQLVYPDWVKMLVDGENPPSFCGNGHVICHCSYMYREDYEHGHIPGAVHLDTLGLESPKTWNRRSAEEIEQTLLGLGITQDTTVIVYGRFMHPNNEDPYPGRLAGHLAAMQSAAILRYAGVKDGRILNGGFARWKELGYPITQEEPEIEKAADFGAEIPQNPQYFIDTPEAKEFISADDAELVSIRSWDEFIGDVSGYHYIDKVGRIPGAVFGNCGSDAYHMENYRNIDHTIRNYHEVAKIWAEWGIVPDKRVSFYCGTGWRGSQAFINAYLMGWPRVSVYDGGWFEWSNDPENPVAVGVPEEDVVSR
jgi:thiosulfate/3-mercaptopyruvate sulfurtransferase